MLAEQDDLARRRNNEALQHTIDLERLDSRDQSVLADLLLAPHALKQSSRSRLVHDANGACFEKRGFKVVDKVLGILDSDAEADEILGKVAGGANGGVDGGVPVGGDQLPLRQNQQRRNERTT